MAYPAVDTSQPNTARVAFVLTIAMGVGIFVATVGMWLPNI